MKTSARKWAAAVLLLAAGQRLALGHAYLDRADPPVGGAVAASPTEVKIWFDSALSEGTIRVLDGQGKEVDKKDTHVDAKNLDLLIVSVGVLPAGTYKVVWQATSTDTHRTEGDFTFAVKP